MFAIAMVTYALVCLVCVGIIILHEGVEVRLGNADNCYVANGPSIIAGDKDKSELDVLAVTWNLQDLSMDANVADGFKVIFKRTASTSLGGREHLEHNPDIIVVGLQETSADTPMQNVVQTILEAAHTSFSSRYAKFAVAESKWRHFVPQYFRRIGHGTSATVVLVRKDKIENPMEQPQVCSDVAYFDSPVNGEKAATAVKLWTDSKASLCFATMHLPSKSPEQRKTALKLALGQFNNTMGWSECDVHVYAGDVNSRTAADTPPKTRTELPSTVFASDAFTSIQSDLDNDQIPKLLREKDEMIGEQPWTGTPALLNHKDEFPQLYKLSSSANIPGGHVPTYKLDSSSSNCLRGPSSDDALKTSDHHDHLCYATNRPVSWTDQIFINEHEQRSEFLDVSAVDTVRCSDHLPLIARVRVSPLSARN